MKKFVYIGYDSPFPQAFAVAARSVKRSLGHTKPYRSIHGLHLRELQERGLYQRPISTDERGRLVDVISGAPMSTEFALSRFLVPHLAGSSGAAIFMDCDMLIRGNVLELFQRVKDDPSKAVWVVKHDLQRQADIQAALGVQEVKMDGQVQTWYARKLWSSFMVFNLSHPAVKNLPPYLVNSAPGLYLHQFGWCHDEEIGELPASWNWLVGMQPEPYSVNMDAPSAANVHWTLGGPWLTDYEDAPYAQEWNRTLTDWVLDPSEVG